jgi:competence protein ComEA
MTMLARLLARVRGSTWTILFLRAFAFCVALLVLAWIGSSAAANAPPPALGNASITSADGDAAAAPASAFPRASSLFADGGGLPPPSPPPIATPPAPATSSARASAEAPVYLNHASVDELRRLPGVGPKRAEAILALRQRLGRFHRVEDLLRVKGVGRTTLKKWRPLVRLDAPPSAATDGGA